mmetsp:Transcript_447/g.968  ORF Transcript_447/g.968 Transcript_447/m.968 type:complete len:212 (-) Transcript_447:812-1447(-)
MSPAGPLQTARTLMARGSSPRSSKLGRSHRCATLPSLWEVTSTGFADVSSCPIMSRIWGSRRGFPLPWAPWSWSSGWTYRGAGSSTAPGMGGSLCCHTRTLPSKLQLIRNSLPSGFCHEIICEMTFSCAPAMVCVQAPPPRSHTLMFPVWSPVYRKLPTDAMQVTGELCPPMLAPTSACSTNCCEFASKVQTRSEQSRPPLKSMFIAMWRQ